MLSEIRIENFKCFQREVVVPCGQLNLLTGVNGKGKSTTLQALLLVHQSLARALSGNQVLQRIELNGRYVCLGSFREIQNSSRPIADPVQIGFEFTDGPLASVTRLSLASESSARWAWLSAVQVQQFHDAETIFEKSCAANDAGSVSLDFYAKEPLRDEMAENSGLFGLRRVHYISADRLGPKDFFPWSADREDFLSVGVRGEYTAEVLKQAETNQETASPLLSREEAPTQTIEDQTGAWLSYVFDGGKVRVAAPHSTILTLEMNSDGSPNYYRAVNLGFGYSYALPILVAALVARPGDILVVENPEAHLHPLAQSRIGELLARVSTTGVQVFVESHSEHLLNAFRMALRDLPLQPESLSVLYFRRDTTNPLLRVSVEGDGRIPHWPDGFFDQRARDFLRLFGE
jgi:predicted ATPase